MTVFLRDGCHLCADALAVLRRLQAETPFAIDCVDIEADDALHRRYLERIPVVAIDGEELSHFFVDEAAVLARVRSGDG